MDQNQPNVDNDLQKAIDDITNTTNIDPVFSDPVAAPSSVPEGDTGELAEPVGPFPEPKLEVVEPAPETIAPLDAASNIPDLAMPEPPAPAPAPTAAEPVLAPAPAPEIPAPAPTPEPLTQNLTTSEIKKAALRDLIPVLDKISLDPTQKFEIYRSIFEDLKDYSVLDPAYHAAREIPDEAKRAEALFYLVEAIDKM
ncbi:hypothetical protein IKF30_00925 [Candidatus Saccharibacteria bacterium]|nr:hypothetical protein [Candidatus Saccharibacteria bacterium]